VREQLIMTKARSRATRSTTKISPRASRHAKPAVSYREESSEGNPEASDTEPGSDSDEPIIKKAAKKRSSRPRAESTPVSAKRRCRAPHSFAPSFLSPIVYRQSKRRQPKRIHNSHESLAKPIS
jgi:hypothetical protein